jgi:hypothetical protein
MTAALDPIGAHVAELDRVLRGPATVKRSMITEVREGLADAVAAHQDRGLDPRHAAAAAVREFGTVGEVAPLMQEELTARQGRRTALLLVVLFPATLVAWDAVWMTGSGWSAPPSATVAALARAVDALTLVIATAALIPLLASFRTARLPRWVTGLTGVIGALGVIGCGGLSVVMNVLAPHHDGQSLAASPATALVIAFSATAGALVTRSAIRSLRFARGCRRSDEGADPQIR